MRQRLDRLTEHNAGGGIPDAPRSRQPKFAGNRCEIVRVCRRDIGEAVSYEISFIICFPIFSSHMVYCDKRSEVNAAKNVHQM